MSRPPIIAIIPARIGSTRFPGKMLANATGQPLIQHVCERTSLSNGVDRVIVATDDRGIADAVRGFGGDVVMTRDDHPNGTSRISEAADALALSDDTLVVNVQGDEPEFDLTLIDRAVTALLAHPDCVAGTAASPFGTDDNATDPNLVKVVTDITGRALLFSRALIPHDRDGDGVWAPLKHIGLYVYRRPFLRRYVRLQPTPLELSEKLEQLRILEHGEKIAVAVAPGSHPGIDTPAQYEAFVARWRAKG